ncbi:MAG: hypothetical protein DRG31_04335, partial [Deltaproteobacteria bacterium]
NGYNQSTYIQIDALDKSGVDTLWINITYPNGTSIEDFMNPSDLSSARYWYYLNDTNLFGDYNVTVYGNDTYGWNSSISKILRVAVNTTITIETQYNIYYINDTVYLASSNIQNTGSSNFTSYLLMQIERYNPDTLQWELNETIINETDPRTINSSDTVYLDTIWNNAGGWDTHNKCGGDYRVYVAFTDIYGNVLRNDDGSYLNATYPFELRNDTGIPAINEVNVTPSESGYGQIVNITANITDDQGILMNWIEIVYPNSSTVTYNMTNVTPEIFYLEFNDTWYRGDYNFTIYVYDIDSNYDIYSGQFTVSATIQLNLSVAYDTYYENDIVTLTPYNWWDETWHYRIPVVLYTGYTQRDPHFVVKHFVNFTDILLRWNITADLDRTSMRIINGSGYEVESDVVRWFDDGGAMVRWRLGIDTMLDKATNYTYYIYFDTVDHGIKGTPDYIYNMPDEFVVCSACYAQAYRIGYSHYNGSFYGWQENDIGADVRRADVADFDNDGDYDFVISDSTSNTYRFYKNTGDGNFANAFSALNPYDSWGGMCHGDFNEDGLMDLAVEHYDGSDQGRVYLLINQGNWIFNAVDTGIDAGSGSSRNMGCGDFNGDGHIDIAAGTYNRPVKLLLGDGTGGFTDAGTISSMNHDAHGFFEFDYDQDGDLDLIVQGRYYYLHLYINNGDGTFTEQSLDGSVLDLNVWADGSVWDVDNDGYPDMTRGDWSDPAEFRVNWGDPSNPYWFGSATIIKQFAASGTNDRMKDCKMPEYPHTIKIYDLTPSRRPEFNTSEEPSIAAALDSKKHTVYVFARIEHWENLPPWNWVAVDTVLNNVKADIDPQWPLEISQIWLDAGGWNTTTGSGNYRVYLELRDKYGNNLTNDDGAVLTDTSEFTVTSDTEPPVILNYDVYPDLTGYGHNITVDFNITDGSDIDTVFVNISYPNGTVMNAVPSIEYIYEYLNRRTYWMKYIFNDTWPPGDYNFSVFAVDTKGYAVQTGVNTSYVYSNASLSLNTTHYAYPWETIINLTNSHIINSGSTPIGFYLALVVQNWTGSSWETINETLNETYMRILQPGESLDLVPIWTSYGAWNTSYNAYGDYRLLLSLENPSGYVLRNETLEFLNRTRNFTIVSDTDPPVIENITATPDVSGFGSNVTLTFDITDNGNLAWILLNITIPENVSQQETLPVYKGRHTYIYNNTWFQGIYNATIFANDTSGNNITSWITFMVDVNVSMNVSTPKDSYYHNQTVMLTSPYEWWNTSWHYRLPLKVNATDFNRSSHNMFVIELINFTDLFAYFGYTATFDVNSTRVIEYYENTSLRVYNDSYSDYRKYEIPYKVYQVDNFDQVTNAAYKIKWKIDGDIRANHERIYMIYFDMEENGLKPAHDPYPSFYPDDIYAMTARYDDVNEYLKLQSGTLSSPVAWSIDEGNDGRDVAVADFDNDGDYDVVHGASGTVFLAENDGDLTFTSQGAVSPLVYLESSVVSGFAAADYNLDGNDDFVVSGDNDVFKLFLGYGNGTFNYMDLSGTGAYYALAKDAADFNNDMKPDFATIRSSDGRVHVYLNDGTANFTIISGVDTPSTRSYCLAAGDFDEDGYADIIVSNYATSADFLLYRGYGNGCFDPSYTT